LNKGLTIQPTRPRPLPKPRNLPIPLINRQLTSKIQETSVLSLFKSVQASQAAAITTDFGPKNNENYRSQPCLLYPREAKLQAI
jgi:hypothetical protein